MRYLKAKTLLHMALPSMLLLPSLASADIATSPLFLQAQVKSNIFFLVDDSGSMDWEILKSDGAKQISDYDFYRNDGTLFWWPDPGYNYLVLEACAGYNVLHYDPNVTYSPWVGEDDDGVAYADQSITAARLNPYDADAGTKNLTNPDSDGFYPGYFTWSDDGDGVLQQGECPDTTVSGFDFSDQFVATNSAAGAGTMTDAEKTNFANWYTYYRKREYVAKAALLGIVNGATERVGLATLHLNNSVAYPVADMSVAANKEALLTQIEKIDSSGGTPLRSKLEEVGEYFSGTSASDLFGSTQSSPILDQASGGSCQQNFAVVMSDGYWNGSDPGVDNADSDGAGDFDGGRFADSYDDTLADVAMHYYEGDLNTSLDNLVPTSALDQNNKQHLVTYTVAFGVNGTLSAGPDDDAESFSWPEPVADTATAVDDMRHAALNGRGEFLSASSPDELTTALNQAINSISEASASSSSIATNSTRLDANSKVYQARFSSATWQGSLLAYDIDEISGAVQLPAAWDAADLIPAEASRKIYTSTGAAASGVEFQYSNLSATQKGQISSDQLDYIRGDQSQEGSGFRSRIKVLGDVINSDPIYTSADNFNYYVLETTNTGDATYDTYLSGTTYSWQKGKRTDVIYFGANDGMLHALLGKDVASSLSCNPAAGSCDEGEELFAYVPKALYQKAYDSNKGLADLTSVSYQHQYFVDGSPRHADAYIDFDDTGERWGTALVGTLAAGGRGIFALDISDPLSFSGSDVLWDLDDTDTGMSELGYTFSQPAIVKLKDDSNTNNNDWGVIVGNGYGSANGKAVLYILGLKTGEIIWQKEVETTSGANGLSTPIAIDTNGDKIADTVYAGDLQGNMWKFDISDSSASKWDVAYSHKLSGSTYASDPLFRACTDDPCTDPQPITSKPQVINADNGGVIVLFGTGKYFEVGDNTDFSQIQTFYGIQDDGNTVSGRDSLVAQDIVYEKTAAQTGLNYDVRVTSKNSVNFSSKDGWYLDFDNAFGNYPGERIVANPLVRNGRVIFATLIPEGDPCAFGGTSWLMEMDAQTGSRLDVTPFDLNDDGSFNSSDWVDTDGDGDPDTPASGKKSTVGIIKTPGVISTGDDEKKYTSGSSGDIEVTTESSGDSLGRQSWQQIR